MNRSGEEDIEKNIYFNSKNESICSRDCRYLQINKNLTIHRCNLFYGSVDANLARCKECINAFTAIDL